MCGKICAEIHHKNLPKGRNITYLEDPGIRIQDGKVKKFAKTCMIGSGMSSLIFVDVPPMLAPGEGGVRWLTDDYHPTFLSVRRCITQTKKDPKHLEA